MPKKDPVKTKPGAYKAGDPYKLGKKQSVTPQKVHIESVPARKPRTASH